MNTDMIILNIVVGRGGRASGPLDSPCQLPRHHPLKLHSFALLKVYLRTISRQLVSKLDTAQLVLGWPGVYTSLECFSHCQNIQLHAMSSFYYVHDLMFHNPIHNNNPFILAYETFLEVPTFIFLFNFSLKGTLSSKYICLFNKKFHLP